MVRLALVCLALTAFPSAALACINDDELPAHEREFRSQYRDTVVRSPERPAFPVSSQVLIGAGIALLAGAAALTLAAGRAEPVR